MDDCRFFKSHFGSSSRKSLNRGSAVPVLRSRFSLKGYFLYMFGNKP